MSDHVKAVSVHAPKVSLEYRPDGGVDIKLDDWVYVSVNYDYRYTNNAMRHALAEKIAHILTGAKP